jgi:hypothetical protein
LQIKTIVINKIIHTLFFCACFFCLQWANGQVKFYAQVSQSPVAWPEPFQLQYIVEGTKNVRDFKLPVFQDFKVEQDFEQVSNMVTMNGQSTQVVESYNKIIILSPRKTGRFVIPAAEAVVNGKKMRTNTVSVVIARMATPSVNTNMEEEDIDGASRLLPGQKPEDNVHKNFFIRAEVNKKTCYVGEPLMAVYKAYMRLNANAQVVKRPSLNGFSVFEMVDAYDNRQEREMYNGVPYYVNVIRKVQLIPLQDGEFVLDPAEVEGVVHFNQKEAGTDNWSSLDYPINVKSEPIAITVKPLPVTDQPAAFPGAVGQFSIAVNTPPSPIRQGDLVKIQVVISGTGNLPLITAPAVVWPKGVDTADPAVKEDLNKYTYPLSGSKQFEYSFAAPDTGDCIIPAISFHYYDPEQKAYKTAVSQPVTLHITAAAGKAEMEQRNTELVQGNESGIPKHLYFFGLIVLLIAGWIFYQSSQLKKARKKAMEPVVKEVAPVIPVQREPSPDDLLAVARDAVQQVDKRLFCHEVQRVLWKTVADKCQVLPSALNKNNIAGRLAAIGVADTTIKNLLTVLQECEWALYAPDQQVDDMKRIFYEARSILQQFQQA